MDRSDLKNARDAIGDALDLMTDLVDILDLRVKADADEISQAVADLAKERDRLAEQVVNLESELAALQAERLLNLMPGD